MAQPGHLLPRDFRVRRAKCRRDFSRSLAHHFELAEDGALMQVAGEKRAFIETCDEGQRILGGKHDVEKKRRIAPTLVRTVRRHKQAPRASGYAVYGYSCG